MHVVHDLNIEAKMGHHDGGREGHLSTPEALVTSEGGGGEGVLEGGRLVAACRSLITPA